jgi:2-polyprenyl-3-methyl-5-hydroxy-6-metoxy-1,4-benzoquinol methylase
MPLCDCHSYDARFDAATAARELAAYQTHGPSKHAQGFLDCLLSTEMPENAMLLDVGGGIGVLGHRLIGRGVTDVALVEASEHYLDIARSVAEDLRVVTRWSFHHGDMVKLVDELMVADLVTMDRVICCYPNHEALLKASAACSRSLIAFSYPHDRFYIRWVMALENLYHWTRGSDFRVFVHSPAAMHAVLEEVGFELVNGCKSWVWEMCVYRKRAAG